MKSNFNYFSSFRYSLGVFNLHLWLQKVLRFTRPETVNIRFTFLEILGFCGLCFSNNTTLYHNVMLSYLSSSTHAILKEMIFVHIYKWICVWMWRMLVRDVKRCTHERVTDQRVQERVMRVSVVLASWVYQKKKKKYNKKRNIFIPSKHTFAHTCRYYILVNTFAPICRYILWTHFVNYWDAEEQYHGQQVWPNILHIYTYGIIKTNISSCMFTLERNDRLTVIASGLNAHSIFNSALTSPVTIIQSIWTRGITPSHSNKTLPREVYTKHQYIYWWYVPYISMPITPK